MNPDTRKPVNFAARSISTLALSVAIALGLSTPASAGELDAKRLVKAMSEFLAAQQALSFNYDATLEVVTPEDQILALASSCQLEVKRPDKTKPSMTTASASSSPVTSPPTAPAAAPQAQLF